MNIRIINLFTFFLFAGLFSLQSMLNSASHVEAVVGAGDDIVVDEHAQFKALVGPFFALPLADDAAVLSWKKSLEERIKKVSAGISRINIELEDPIIASVYGEVERIYASLKAGEHVGVDVDFINQMIARLKLVLSGLPDLSATSSGESDPSLDDKSSVLGDRIRAVFPGLTLTRYEKFSDVHSKTVAFFSATENKDRMAEFSSLLLQDVTRGVVVVKQGAYSDSGRSSRENQNFVRLLAYHLARAAGYDAEDLITTLLNEMQECIEGSSAIVHAFNRILIADIRPLLLGQKLLEQPAVLAGYFDAIKRLAALTRLGDSNHTAYGTSDGIYTELQRLYSSLQLHVLRLRIEEFILPALEQELGNLALAKEAEERQRALQLEQEARRIQSTTEDKRNEARRASLDRLIADQKSSLAGLFETHKENMAAGEADGVIAEARARMEAVIAQFNEAVRTAGDGVDLNALYVQARKDALAAADAAREVLQGRARAQIIDRRAKAFQDFEAARAARIARLTTVTAEHDWRTEDRTVVSAAKELAFERAVQSTFAEDLVRAILAKKAELKKMKMIRVGQVNQLLDDTVVQKALRGIDPSMREFVIAKLIEGGLDPAIHLLDVDVSRINKPELFERLRAIVVAAS